MIIRLILGDQLNRNHSWFAERRDDVVYAFFESQEEASYAPHHVQKVVGIFSAMRQFAHDLQQQGHTVHYASITTNPHRSIADALRAKAEALGARRIECQYPDEYRLLQQLRTLGETATCELAFCASEHFISDPREFKAIFKGKKTFLMETFYRQMRKKTGLLLVDGQPLGGKWNYDADNRQKLPKGHKVPPHHFPTTDVRDVVDEVVRAGIKTIGRLERPAQFYWPTTAAQAWTLFEHWLEHGFAQFGAYQDAMTTSDWALYHSRISFALNLKLIDPLEVCRRAEAYFLAHEEVPLNAAEGFIRQIIGWREYMRGVYWVRMPEFGQENYFGHKRPLPQWFWTGETKMACQRHAIGQSLEHGYAHHIQRLMVTGNFLLLAGIDPDEVDLWYLGIYIDAFEWVEMTNARGMSQYADGGWIASKPYVASANYMTKMGDYCTNCHYDPKSRTEERSCPLNALYWDFFERNRELLQNNFRLAMVYRTWDKQSAEQKSALLSRSAQLLDQLDRL